MTQSFGIDFGNALLKANEWPIDNVTFLRTIAAEQFQTKMQNAAASIENGSWSAVDGFVLSELPLEIYSDPSRELNVDAIIAGFNSMDGIMAKPVNPAGGTTPKSDEEYRKMLGDWVQKETLENRLYSDYYPPSDFPKYYYSKNASYTTYELAVWTLNSDICLLCPSLKWAEYLASNEMEPEVFVYEFNGQKQNNSYRAGHGAEEPFAFNLERGDAFWRLPWDQNLSNSMVSSWVNMGIDGVPDISNRIDGVDMK